MCGASPSTCDDVLARTGARRSEIEAFARTHPEARIELHPYVPQERLPEALAAADVHLASLDPAWDGLWVPSKLQGIFAAGRPVIFVGSCRNEAARWIREAEAGWVVAPGDVASLLRAIAAASVPEERARRGAAARAFAKAHFDPHENCRRICDLLEAAAAGTRQETICPTASLQTCSNNTHFSLQASKKAGAALMTSVYSIVRYVWCHPANCRRRVRSMARAVGWQVWKRLTGCGWNVVLPGGLTLRCEPDSTSASAVIYASGYPDYHEMRLLQHVLRQGDTFVDVGANIGVYSLLAAALVGPEGKVIAVEAGKAAADRFRANVNRNGLRHVVLHEVAATERDGPLRFTRGGDSVDRIVAGAVADRDYVVVPGRRLDDLLAGTRPVLAKMDIEGAELSALRGCETMLGDALPPIWLLEVNDCLRDYGLTADDLRSWLDTHGYDMGAYDSDERIFKLGGTPWTEAPNVVAVARRALDDVLARTGARLVRV